jgi:hypothetical protein
VMQLSVTFATPALMVVMRNHPGEIEKRTLRKFLGRSGTNARFFPLPYLLAILAVSVSRSDHLQNSGTMPVRFPAVSPYHGKTKKNSWQS